MVLTLSIYLYRSFECPVAWLLMGLIDHTTTIAQGGTKQRQRQQQRHNDDEQAFGLLLLCAVLISLLFVCLNLQKAIYHVSIVICLFSNAIKNMFKLLCPKSNGVMIYSCQLKLFVMI